MFLELSGLSSLYLPIRYHYTKSESDVLQRQIYSCSTTLISHNIKTANCVGLPYADNSSDPLLRGLHKTFEGVLWYLVNSRFAQSCELRGWAFMDQTRFSSTSHIGLRYWECGGQVNTVSSVTLLKPFLNNFCSGAVCIILLKETTAIQEYRCLGLEQC